MQAGLITLIQLRMLQSSVKAHTSKSGILMTHEVGAGEHIILTTLQPRVKLRPDSCGLPCVLMAVPTEAGPDGHFA